MPALPENATISDILPTLDNAESYVRQVLGNMADYRKTHGAAVVRLGTTGRGIAPHYRVQKEHDEAGFGELLGRVIDDESGYFTAFHGRSHKQLAWGSRELRGQHWSTRAMSFDEVQSVLGQLRGYQRA
jgi:hypothetical protein